jgi:hypothetical protein
MGFNSFGLPPNLQGGIPQGQPASANPFLEKRTSGPLPVIENELLPFAFDSIKNSVGGHGPVNSLSNIPLFSSKGFSGRRIEEPSNGKETAVPAMTSSSIQESKSESPTVEQFGINPTGLTVSKINKDGSKTFGFGLGGFNYGKENKEGGYAIGVNPLTRSFRAGVQNPNWGASIQMGLGPTESPNPFGFLQGNIQFGNNPNSTDTPLLNKSLSELAGAVTNPNQGLPSEAQRYAVEELGLPVNPSSSQPESEAQKYLRSFLDSRRTNQQIYW